MHLLPLGALLSPRTACGAGGYTYYHIWQANLRYRCGSPWGSKGEVTALPNDDEIVIVRPTYE